MFGTQKRESHSKCGLEINGHSSVNPDPPAVAEEWFVAPKRDGVDRGLSELGRSADRANRPNPAELGDEDSNHDIPFIFLSVRRD